MEAGCVYKINAHPARTRTAVSPARAAGKAGDDDAVSVIRIFAVALLLGCSGCGFPESTLRPGGPAAGNIAQIGWIVYILLGALAAIMWLLLLWASIRRPGSLKTHEPWNEGGGQDWVLIGGFAIPFVVLCGLFVFSVDRTRDFPLHGATDPAPEINVIGHQWWWEVQYLRGEPSTRFVTANEIHIPVGRPIEIKLETQDVIHSFWVPALHGKMEMIPGQPNFIRIQADHPGNFEGQCSEYCGEEHARMRLLVVAQSDRDYEAWRNQQLQPASEPQGEEAIHGRDVFDYTACALCHTVRGTAARGRVAPDLTHLASRQFIAANSYRNNKANLAAWATHAQSLKPGAAMPDLTEYNGEDLRALTAYLLQLK